MCVLPVRRCADQHPSCVNTWRWEEGHGCFLVGQRASRVEPGRAGLPRRGALKPAARWALTGLSRVLGAADQDMQRLLRVLKYLLK